MIQLTEVQKSIEHHRVRQNRWRAKQLGLDATLTLEEWLSTLERFQGRCAYCQRTAATVLEHFIPLSAGGGTVVENCIPACSSCNAKKRHKPAHKDEQTGLFVISSDRSAGKAGINLPIWHSWNKGRRLTVSELIALAQVDSNGYLQHSADQGS